MGRGLQKNQTEEEVVGDQGRSGSNVLHLSAHPYEPGMCQPRHLGYARFIGGNRRKEKEAKMIIVLF